MPLKRWLLPALLLPSVVLYYALDLHHVLTLETMKTHQAAIEAFRDAHPVLTVGAFLMGFIGIGLLPLPVAALLSAMAGALYGTALGFVVVTFTSTLGAAAGFMIARYGLREPLARRYADQARLIDAGIARDGALYLLTMRLVPVLPFSLINLAFGLSAMRLLTFTLVSQLGMAPSALLFANAGRELSKLDSLDDLMSPGVIASLTLVAALPWLGRALVTLVQRRRYHEESR